MASQRLLQDEAESVRSTLRQQATGQNRRERGIRSGEGAPPDERIVIKGADVGPERRVIHGDRPDFVFGLGLLAAHLKRDLKQHGADLVQEAGLRRSQEDRAPCLPW